MNLVKIMRRRSFLALCGITGAAGLALLAARGQAQTGPEADRQARTNNRIAATLSTPAEAESIRPFRVDVPAPTSRLLCP